MQGAHSSFRDMPCKGIARLSGVVGTLLDKNQCVGEHESWQNVGKPLLQLWEGQIIGRRDGGEVGTEIGLICLTSSSMSLNKRRIPLLYCRLLNTSCQINYFLIVKAFVESVRGLVELKGCSGHICATTWLRVGCQTSYGSYGCPLSYGVWWTYMLQEAAE